MNYYHAGPKGLTELRTGRDLIESGAMTVEQYAEAWEAKWGDFITDPFSLMAHPALDEICFFTNLEDAQILASQIDGAVYAADLDYFEVVANNEGAPSVFLPLGGSGQSGSIPCAEVSA